RKARLVRRLGREDSPERPLLPLRRETAGRPTMIHNLITPRVCQELFSMIVVMEKEASPDQIQHMVERVEGLGLKAHVIVGTERTVIAAIGEKRSQMKES